MKRPEILAPASSLEVLKTAIQYGADAVYIGGEAYGLRAKAKNFSMEDMKEGIEFAHEHGVKVYVTANITAHDGDLEGVEQYFEELKEIHPDALIIIRSRSFYYCKRDMSGDRYTHQHPGQQCELRVHSASGKNQGATRVVTARELSIERDRGDLMNIYPEDLEIETFVHGAMCISYSGRCLLSNYFTGRDANQGACTHPCRWKYHLCGRDQTGRVYAGI